VTELQVVNIEYSLVYIVSRITWLALCERKSADPFHLRNGRRQEGEIFRNYRQVCRD